MNKIIQGNCLEKLKELEDNSVDSIVTDPPYELGFMGKSFDSMELMRSGRFGENEEIYKEVGKLNKGEFLLIEKSEWKVRTHPSIIICSTANHEGSRFYGKKFSIVTLRDKSGYVVKRIK